MVIRHYYHFDIVVIPRLLGTGHELRGRGAKKREGGGGPASEVSPLPKGGAEKF